jgi:hypothetical protein
VSLGDLTPAEIRYYALDPVAWVKDVRNATPDDWQAAILSSYVDHPLEAVRSATGVGKGWLFSVIDLHFLHVGYLIPWLRKLPGASDQPPKVILTSTDEEQLHTALWTEHKIAIDESNGLGDIFEWTATRIRHRSREYRDTWYAAAITSAKRRDGAGGFQAGGSQGQHRQNMMIGLDEAAHIEEPYWAAFLGTLSQRYNRLFAFGNPDRLSGMFYRIWHDKALKDLWKRHTISGRPHPLADYVSARAQEGPNQGILLKTWGSKHPIVQAKIYGVHPTLSLPNTSFSFEEFMAARERVYIPTDNDTVQIGCDVARSGNAETVYTIRRGWLFRQIIERHRTVDQIGDKLLELAEEEPDATAAEHDYSPLIVIDETGVGGGVVDYVRRKARGLKIRIRAVTFGGQARHPEKYFNIAAEMWCEDAKEPFRCERCGRWFEAHLDDETEAGVIIPSKSDCPRYLPLAQIPDDDTLMTQAITREIKPIAPLAGKRSNIGRRQLQSKEEIQQKGGVSPDRMDSFCLSVVKPRMLRVL